jgi:hypothetical protein
MLAGSALAAGDTNNISAPSTNRRALPPVNNAAQTEGGLQRGVRLGNPAQMFNPFASARYGDGREYVTERTETDKTLSPRENTRSAPVGLRLFSFSF